VGGFATPSHYISLDDIIPQNVDIVPQRFFTKSDEISDKHFYISSNKKKVKNYASLILQLFLLIPLRQHAIAVPRFNSLPLVLLCHRFSFNHSVYHSNLAITGAYFRIILFLINTCTCASQSCSFSFVYLPLFR